MSSKKIKKMATHFSMVLPLIKERIRFELMNLCSSVLDSMFCLCWDLCQREKQKSWNDPINAPPCRNRQFSDELFKHRHSFPSLFSFISRAGTDVSVAWALLLNTTNVHQQLSQLSLSNEDKHGQRSWLSLREKRREKNRLFRYFWRTGQRRNVGQQNSLACKTAFWTDPTGFKQMVLQL